MTKPEPLSDDALLAWRSLCEHHGSWTEPTVSWDDIKAFIATIDALKARQEWRPINNESDGATWGWLYSPPENLWEGGVPPEGKRNMPWYDIRFGQPRNFKWATHIIPSPVPTPPKDKP